MSDGEVVHCLSVAGAELFSALSKAQGQIDNVKKTSQNPHFKSAYADLASVWDTIREPLTSNGLSVLQLPCEAPEGKVGLETIIGHSSGQRLSRCYYIGVKDANNPQQYGSALTYMKRYALLGVAGIAPEDDDGEAGTGRAAPAKAPADPAVYQKLISDTLEQLKGLPDEEARALYAKVNNSGMAQPYKNELLTQMADVIRSRQNTKKGSK